MDCTLTTEERWVVCGTKKVAVCMGKRGKIPHTMLYPCLKGHGPIEACTLYWQRKNRVERYPCLKGHGPIEAYCGYKNTELTLEYPCLKGHGPIEAWTTGGYCETSVLCIHA